MAKSAAAGLVAGALAATGLVGIREVTAPTPGSRAVADYGKLPLVFETNVGQADASVRFLARTGGATLFLTPSESVLSGPGGVLRLALEGANPDPAMTGLEPQAGRVNYLRGADPTAWRTDVPVFAKVVYEGVYPGIDMLYYGTNDALEYDLIVAPGVDPAVIALTTTGANSAHVDAAGDLVLEVGTGEVRQRRPVAYQDAAGRRTPVEADYELRPDGRVSFALGAHDPTRPLVIDPLVYSTFLGGNSSDTAYGMAVDGSGSAYVVGSTSSTDFPVAGTPVQADMHEGQLADAFVTKLNPSGSALVYSTYLGGSAREVAFGVAVDGSGNAYVVGTTTSSDFLGATIFPGAPPLVFDASQPHAFVAKVNPAGSALLYSKLLGGSVLEEANAIAVDGAGNAYVTGSTRSVDFPVVGGFQPAIASSSDAAFVAKVNPAGSALVYSSYLSGSGETNIGRGIAVDGPGNAYVVGETTSSDFPVAGTPFQAAQRGIRSGFVTKVNPAGSGLVYSTYLGGNNVTDAFAIALDGDGNAFVTGSTDSADFPTAGPPFQAGLGGGLDAFATKVDPTGSALSYSTYLGGVLNDIGYGIAVSGDGVAHVAGGTKSNDYPTLNPLQLFKKTESDAFVTDVSATGSALLFSTYLGGNGVTNNNADEARAVALDGERNTYVAGSATAGFPIAGSPVQGSPAGIVDAFVAKLSPSTGGSTTTSSSSSTSSSTSSTSSTTSSTSTTTPPTTSSSTSTSTSTSSSTSTTSSSTSTSSTSTTVASSTTTSSTTTSSTTTSSTTTSSTTTSSTTTSTSPSTTTTSTTLPTTTTVPGPTTTAVPGSTTTTSSLAGRCEQLVVSQRQFNSRIDRLERALRGPLASRLLQLKIAQLEAIRATGNAQLAEALRACFGAF